MMKFDPKQFEMLYQRWRHSHEEDRAGQMVFRPASFDFPFSRGRYELEISPPDQCVFQDIAMGDGTTGFPCRVESDTEQMQICINYPEWSRRFDIVDIKQDKLVLLENLAFK